tara:strand:- start:301 stop:513 length:213 start_codon:yes stop_codon:yes gene_type:complete
MKKVNFNLEIEVHKDLKDEILKDYVSSYLINQEKFNDFRLNIIGGKNYPKNFEIGSIKFDLKKKKAKAKK